ncbi:MAG: flagellar protein FlaG [Proteobacteria bacterium]|nr:flagellar protein FlaG [Pseudomonadota bacterium]
MGTASPAPPAAQAPGGTRAVTEQVVNSTGASSLAALERAVTQVHRHGERHQGATLPPDYNVELAIDEATGRVYGKMVSKETGEVIGQIPSREMMALLARTREILGPLLDQST